jgi:hypothetical protein
MLLRSKVIYDSHRMETVPIEKYVTRAGLQYSKVEVPEPRVNPNAPLDYCP